MFFVAAHTQDAVMASSSSQPSFDSLIDTDFGTTTQQSGQQDLFADFTSASANDSFGDFNPRAGTTPAPAQPDFANFESNAATQG